MDPNKLMFVARKAMERAHAPYSNHRVGAILICADGTVFKGCNVENAAYGESICAERTAVVSAVAAGKKEFKALAIVASQAPTPFPCGACRQVLSEFCGPDFPIFIATGNGYEVTTLGELLPHAFYSSDYAEKALFTARP